MKRLREPLMAGLILAAAALAQSMPGPKERATAIKAVRILIGQGDYLQARHALWVMLFRTATDIDAEYLLGRCHEGLGEQRQAVAMYTTCLRSIREDEKGGRSRFVRMAADCRARIGRVDDQGRRRKQAYAAAAAGKKFASPEKVGDLWMDQVTATKLPLEMLGHPGAFVVDAVKKGWRFDRKLGAFVKPPPGGETAFQSAYTLTGPQRFPQRHLSGAAFVAEAGGRKGILKTAPNWQTKKPTRLTIRNTGKCRFLRIGASPAIWSGPTCQVAASQDKADFVLNVYVGEKRLLTQVIAGRRWADLKIDLGEFAGKDVEVVVENASGGKHPYYEGAYFDYVDFFDD